jgi:exodeoxyribonuclease VII small subunit
MEPEKTQIQNYEELYAQLLDVVTQLETGELPLEKSLQLYEKGIKLAAACQHVLDTAELRIQQLQQGNSAE